MRQLPPEPTCPLTSPADRIRRVLSDGLPAAEPRSGPPRLRQVDGRATDGSPQRTEQGPLGLSPELRARLDALGVGLAGRVPLRSPDEASGEHTEERADDGPGDRRPPAPALAPPAGFPDPVSPQDGTEATSLDAYVGGIERETPLGAFLYVERHFDLDAFHGRVPLRDGLAHPIPLRPHEQTPGTPRKDEAQMLAASDAVFIDTETTGLSGGTGTVAFLVGTGRVEGDRFVVRQYCMRDYPEEPALLFALHEDIGDLPLVSFNGRGFDWPLLTTRFRLHRAHPAPRAHFDLLPPSRRIWARTLHSHGLAALERHVLELDRGDDLPGWRIPSAYFEYLRSGYADTISMAFRHNEIDVVSMLALFALVAETIEDPIRRVARPGDQLGTARLLLDLGQTERARLCLEAGIADAEGTEGVALRRLLGRLCRRSGEDDMALEHWKRVIDEAPELDIDAYEQVAKIYEHRLSDFDQALAWTERAMARMSGGSARHDALEHRAARLRRRIERRRG